MPDDKKDVRAALDKDVVKEAIKEWLDEGWIAFGKWTAKGLAAAAFAGLVYLSLKGYGWAK